MRTVHPGLAAVSLLSLAGAASASIVYDVPAGITAQPTDDIRWNSTGSYGVGGGVVIAPSYVLTAEHLGQQSSFSLTTTVGGVTTTTSYPVISYQQIGNTDLQVVKINGTFPSSSVVPLYSGSAGSETGQAISFLGYGYHTQGTPVVTNGVQNGWLWGGTVAKNLGQNTVNGIASVPNDNNTANVPALEYTFDPIAGQNEAVYTGGDSGGGTYVFHNGRYELAGINYSIYQFYTAPNAASAINAAIYNSSGLFVQTGTNPDRYALASSVGITNQHGFASEIAPYESQINAITGVPEPTGLVLLSFGTMLLSRSRKTGE